MQGCVAALTQRQVCAEFVAKFQVAELWFHLANWAGNRALIMLIDSEILLPFAPWVQDILCGQTDRAVRIRSKSANLQQIHRQRFV